MDKATEAAFKKWDDFEGDFSKLLKRERILIDKHNEEAATEGREDAAGAR